MPYRSIERQSDHYSWNRWVPTPLTTTTRSCPCKQRSISRSIQEQRIATKCSRCLFKRDKSLIRTPRLVFGIVMVNEIRPSSSNRWNGYTHITSDSSELRSEIRLDRWRIVSWFRESRERNSKLGCDNRARQWKRGNHSTCCKIDFGNIRSRISSAFCIVLIRTSACQGEVSSRQIYKPNSTSIGEILIRALWMNSPISTVFHYNHVVPIIPAYFSPVIDTSCSKHSI